MAKKKGETPPKGHNAKGGVNAEELKSLVERIERLEEEKAGIACDVADVYSEAKGKGFDVKTLRKVINLRKIDAAQREAEEDLKDRYMHALGMLPLFEGQDPVTIDPDKITEGAAPP